MKMKSNKAVGKKRRTIDASWEISQEAEPVLQEKLRADAIFIVDESICLVSVLLNRLKKTEWPGVESLLENKSSRAIMEAEVYLNSAIDSLRKAQRRLGEGDERY